MFNSYTSAIVKLGNIFEEACSHSENFSKEAKLLVDIAKNANILNPWFTEVNILESYQAWGRALAPQKVEQFMARYGKPTLSSKKVGIISAGNIPLVGLHDILCVILSGYSSIIKLSGRDGGLTKLVTNILITIEPSLKDRISYADDRLTGYDAIIATGSNNSARYFEYYFAKYPHIIRKNRNGVALLSGNETGEQLALLGNDIFSYFGLGCRNVSKLYVPKGYNFTAFFEAIEPLNQVAMHHKYANNHAYSRAIWLIDQTPHLDNGFLLLKQDTAIASPIATLYYEEYNTQTAIIEHLNQNLNLLQCVVSNIEGAPLRVDFGQTQQPELWDFADSVDTMKFLETLR
jgi:hypothetical protein